ncbi:glycoside hydrolase family 127 protein [Sphingopyxis sp. FD7]|uniref:glycoside hydrolase family 127 protein n=1 Tax=Sphingopyxis sp. FD7 TaxID=1914525 RepID=UPI000DC6141B|nr:beta-L-arabinofuranosidase domain-containing protein [Sphingopyxis sp. FD7]BBB14541.1 hypothetical protein SPYCA_3799 [Sphingopyxis sp. FD7]
MQLAPPGAVSLGGILGEAVEANRLGRLSRFIVDENSPAIAIFAPDAVATNDQGDWYGEHAGKWLIAATKAAQRANDTVLLARVRQVADWLIARQDADGYLGNYAPARRFMHKQPAKLPTWNGEPTLRTWDIWTHSYLMLGLIEVHRATDEPAYLDAARRIGDLCWRTLTSGIAITEVGNHFGLSASILLDPVIELHSVTNDARYLDLALLIIDQMEADPGNRLLGQALAGADPSEIATGKAYQLLWNMVAIAKLYRATGDQRYLTAALNFWQAVRDRHLTLGGGPWGGVAHRSREVFNAAGTFDPEAYVETCSTMAWIQLNRELLTITAEARFAEEIERSAYNDLLGAQAPDGEDWCYYSFANGRRIHTTYWRCCKSSGAMALEELASVAYGVTAAGEIAINLLGPSDARISVPGVGTVRIAQRTDYPFTGELEIAVDAGGATVPLLLRVPEWAQGARIEGSDTVLEPGRYTRIETDGVVRIVLAMVPCLHSRAARNVQESLAPDGSAVEQEVLRHDYVALTKGPLVYATGLVDGYKTSETVRLGENPVRDVSDGTILLSPRDRAPLAFEPYYRAGGRTHGAWRLTWLRLPPEEAA